MRARDIASGVSGISNIEAYTSYPALNLPRNKLDDLLSL